MIRPDTIEQAVVDNETLARVERLLLQYPGVSDAELAEITQFLRDGTILEIGLLSINQEAWRKAERIRAKHPKRFATSTRGYLGLASALGAILLILALVWAIAV